MRKSHILVPLLVGILMVSVFSAPTVKAATIEELQAQVQQLLQIVMQLQSQLSQILQERIVRPTPPVPTTIVKPTVGQCGWCGVSCQRIQRGMYCPQIAPPAGYVCKDINGVCKKVFSTTPVTTKPITSAITKQCLVSYAGGGLNQNELTREQCKATIQARKESIRYDVCSNIAVTDSENIVIKWGNETIDQFSAQCSTFVMHTSCEQGICTRTPGIGTNQCNSNNDCIQSCTDSDGGRNIYVKGAVTYFGRTYTDESVKDAVKEYYCENNVVRSSIIDCPSAYMSLDGACRLVSRTCTDSDGGKNIYVKGTVTYFGKTYTDESINSAVKEYYCENNVVRSSIINCPSAYTSRDGACLRILPSTSPDLTISGISASRTFLPVGETTKITATEKNIGNASASHHLTGIFEDDIETSIGYRETNSIMPGYGFVLTANYTCYRAGSHTIKAFADYLKEVSESNESNNTKAITISCTTSYWNLMLNTIQTQLVQIQDVITRLRASIVNINLTQ